MILYGMGMRQGFSVLNILEPFGAENPQPLFGLFGMKITGIQPVGGNKHIRLTVNKNGVSLPVMLFSVAPEDFPFCVSDVVDLAIRLSQNEYMGETKVSIQVKDIKLSAINDDALQKQKNKRKCFYLTENSVVMFIDF